MDHAIFTWVKILRALYTGRALLEIGVITGIAGMIIGVLNLSGLGFSVSLSLVHLGGNSLLLLLVLVGLLSMLLGIGMPTVSVYILRGGLFLGHFYLGGKGYWINIESAAVGFVAIATERRRYLKTRPSAHGESAYSDAKTGSSGARIFTWIALFRHAKAVLYP